MPGFHEWESFYVIVGAAAGALIGLQFVVMTLLADKPQLASPFSEIVFSVRMCSRNSSRLLRGVRSLRAAAW